MRASTFLGVTAAVHLALAAWIRRDARRRGVDASPWDRLTPFVGVFGLLGYRRSRAARADATQSGTTRAGPSASRRPE